MKTNWVTLSFSYLLRMLNIKPFNTSLIIFLNASEIIFKVVVFLVALTHLLCTPMARFVFSFIITSIAIASIWSSDGYTVHNSSLAGHVFKTVVSIDWLQCIEECHKHDMCASYNYFPPEEICELNDFGFNDQCEVDDNLIRSNGWIHHVLRISQVTVWWYIQTLIAK